MEVRPRVAMSEIKLFNCDFVEGSTNTVRIPGGMVSTIQIKENSKVPVRILGLGLDPAAARPGASNFGPGRPFPRRPKTGW
ncbi:hypothetical protein [Verrucomicrobium spinosum]|uniref:hypothetical protein n=1 Tax=Verrucomicrobium spinosum TaxID=2736 RepID=UPI0012E1CE2A|nr:hypothetical protein [Verrucomicrobium spinosum]